MRQTRMAVGLALAIGVLALLYAGPVATALVLLLLASFGVKEYYDVQRLKNIRPRYVLGIAVSWLFIALALASIYVERKSYGPQNFAVVVSFFVMGVMVRQFYNAARGLEPISTVDVSVTLFGSIYVGGLISYQLLIWNLGMAYFPGQIGKINTVVFLPLWAAYGSDTGAYFIGSYLGAYYGKTKIAPRVSPNKTLAGSMGAVAVCAGGMALLGKIIGFQFWPLVFMGVFASLASQAGDLCESAFKREHEIKDSGNVFGAHGGFLDRIDSLLFALPVVYYFLYWFPPVGALNH